MTEAKPTEEDAARAVAILQRNQSPAVWTLARAFAEARAAERESCAKLADDFRASWVRSEGELSDGATTCESLAIQIRGREQP